jgi:eukaryotic-like serine/threonine-protein kinase
MHAGELVGGRFEIERLAGAGGMGEVYRARDRQTGGLVALKIAAGKAPQIVERFVREAEVLAELRHPAIVRHVAHGREPDGALYLAMEWLDGEDLGARLGVKGLTMGEAVALVRRVAEALGEAHARGVVHRDVKPSNLFLPGKDATRVTILDFGVARLADVQSMTRTGTIVGTPVYMAPEQARGERSVDARADVFALGSVLFECLTGQAPFFAEHPMGALAKILLEEAPSARQRRPDVPPALDDLLGRMLAKDRALRPADGAAVAAELAGIDAGAPGRAPPGSMPFSGLTNGEQRLLSVLLVGAQEEEEPLSTSATAPTLPGDPAVQVVEAARAVVAAHGGRLDALAGGAFVVSLAGAGAATDQAARAARCAIALRALLPRAPMALSMGRSVIGGSLWDGSGDGVPTGKIIDRGAELLKPQAQAEPEAGGAAGAGNDVPIRIDEMTAGLLDARFEVGGDAEGLVLRRERDRSEAARTVLGRPTPFVGRERDLASLSGLLEQCVAEPMARAALVTAPAGGGKSRLRAELLRGVREGRFPPATEGREPVEIWMACGDPMSSGSPFGMIAQAVRSAAGVLEGELLAVRRQKLRARIGRRLAEADRPRIVEFLGEMVGTPFPGDPELAAARQDARLMGDQVRRAWEDFLAAECAAQPVLLVLEDLHWGDLPSAKLVDAALRNLDDQPFMVLALARPEVHQALPKLWAERGVEEIRLSDLSRGAARKLCRAVLGDDAPDAVVERLIDRAAGNAFYLEELLRAVAERGAAALDGAELPATVLAMVEARIQTLDADLRRALRAASVFGQVFWQDGVVRLLGAGTRPADLAAALSELVRQEVVTRRGEGKFPGAGEHAFRDALFREAAYAMLTEEDRRRGHRLAGPWLEHAGESDSLVLAEHFERGGEPDRAVAWYERAAEQALGGNDFAATLARVERGARCGAAGEVLGRLRLLEAEALNWRGEYDAARVSCHAALAALPRGSASWLAALSRLASVEARQETEGLERCGRELLDLGSAAARDRPAAWAQVAMMLYFAGRSAVADELLAHAEEALGTDRGASADAPPSVPPEGAKDVDFHALGHVHQAKVARAFSAGSHLEMVPSCEAAAVCFERVGDARNACQARINGGFLSMETGAYEEARTALQAGLAAAERLGLVNVVGSARQNLGLALARVGALDEASQVEALAVDAFVSIGDKRMESCARAYLSEILLLGGSLAAAERQARAALATASPEGGNHAFALAMLSRVLLVAGRVHEALATAILAIERLEALGAKTEGDLLMRLVHAEALHGAGAIGEARGAIAVARERVLARAGQIRSASMRRSFLERVPEAARTLALAWEWLGE